MPHEKRRYPSVIHPRKPRADHSIGSPIHHTMDQDTLRLVDLEIVSFGPGSFLLPGP